MLNIIKDFILIIVNASLFGLVFGSVVGFYWGFGIFMVIALVGMKTRSEGITNGWW